MYFEKPGIQNTEQAVEIALNAAKEYGIKDIVLATSRGETAEYFKGKTDGINLTCVTLCYGFSKPGENALSEERRAELKALGYNVVTAAHALSGAERGLSRRQGGIYPVELISASLRMFGDGMKVCVEVASMAADAGCIKPGEPVIVVAGRGKGADTVVIMKAAHTNAILDSRIDRILCKPLLPVPAPAPAQKPPVR